MRAEGAEERMRTLRTFIAIELDEEVHDNLRHLRDRLAGQVAPGSVRWVRPEGIHLTLKFLGDTPVDKVEEVKAALTQAAAEVGPFTFTVTGLWPVCGMLSKSMWHPWASPPRGDRLALI
jgi:2'-5' RNA ligase